MASPVTGGQVHEQAATLGSSLSTALVLDVTAHSFDSHPDGTEFGAWPDTSPAHHSDLPANYSTPIYRKNMTPNGGSAVQFTKTQFYLPDNLLAAATSAELFVVARTDGTTDNPGLYQLGGNDATYYPYTDGNVYDGSFTNTRFSFPGVSPAQWHIYNVAHDGTTRVTRIDNQIVHSATTGFVQPTGSPPGYLGSVINHNWNGYIAEFQVYNRVLTSDERAEAYAALKAAHLMVPPVPIALPAFTLAVSASAAAPKISVPLSVPVMRASVAMQEPANLGRILTVPTAAISVAMSAQVTGGREILTIQPMQLRASASARIAAEGIVTLPPIQVGVRTAAPSVVDATLSLTAPDDGDTVTAPQFVIALTAQDDTVTYTIAVQYGQAQDFSDATTVSADVPAMLGGTTFTPAVYGQGILYWRAQLLQNGVVVQPWTAARTLTVDSQIAPVTLPVTWTVTASAERPVHLWHVDPSGPLVGDTCIVYGQGFPDTGHLVLGGQLLDVTSWNRVAEDPANAVDATRTIDGSTVTPEHYEIVFTVPNYDGPGAALSVEA